jgi:hypothetical protein
MGRAVLGVKINHQTALAAAASIGPTSRRAESDFLSGKPRSADQKITATLLARAPSRQLDQRGQGLSVVPLGADKPQIGLIINRDNLTRHTRSNTERLPIANGRNL